MAGSRERARMPYETSKQEKFAYGLSPRKFRGSGGDGGRALTEEEWGRFPELEKYKGRQFVVDSEEGVLAKDPGSRELVPFREMAGDVEMSEDQWAAFAELLEMASSGEGAVAAEDDGFFRRIGDLLSRLRR